MQSVYIDKGGNTDCLNDFHIKNSRNNTAGDWPGHIYMSRAAGDGATTSALLIDGGNDIHVSDSTFDNATGRSGQGSADGPIVQINPNTFASTSYTNSLFFTNNLVTNGHSQCMLSYAIYVTISGGLMNNCGIGRAANTVNYLEFGYMSSNALAHDSTVVGAMVGDGNSQYAVALDNGVFSIFLPTNGNDFTTGGAARAIYDPGSALPVVGYGQRVEQGTAATSSSTAKAVTFPNAFTTTPTVLAIPGGAGSGGNWFITSASSTGFTMNFANSCSCAFTWIAMGQ